MWDAIRGLLDRAEAAKADEPAPPRESADPDGEADDVPTTRAEWEGVMDDPCDAMLGYQTETWDQFVTDATIPSADVFQPAEAERIDDEEWIVVKEGTVDPERRV